MIKGGFRFPRLARAQRKSVPLVGEVGIAPSKSETPTPLEIEFLDFQIDKTYAALSHAGESIGSSFVYCMLFLALAAALSLGNLEVGDRVQLPLVGITLSRWHAAGLSLVLTSVFFYNLTLMKATERLLALKLDDLIAARFGHEGYHWYIYYPSVFTSSEDLGYVSAIGRLAAEAPVFVMAGLALLIPWLAYITVKSLSWSVVAIALSGTATMILLLGVSVWAAMPAYSANRKQVLQFEGA